MNKWWRKIVVYQIYPKSFKDSNGDGIGDIRGIIEKLDYLQNLGVGALWITPMYCSPQRDNGYDISNYYEIDPMFGTMSDFDELLLEAHSRNIKIIMDIVVNHTSSDHLWFQEAIKNPESKYRDYYIIRDSVNGAAPNNWVSMFGGSAWEKIEGEDKYYLHLFDVTQPDLNWECEELRKEIYKMQNYWMEKGVDGLRLDVINLISKDQSFPIDDDHTGTIGKKFYVNGPKIHQYLKEMNQEVFSKYDSMIVGETMSTNTELAIEYTKPENKELDMIFSMSHMKSDYKDGDKWTPKQLNLKEFRDILSTWQIKLNENNCWNSLFLCNHDLPRAVSRFGNDMEYRKESAKMLATTLHLMRGTPYIYQGEEIGMTNPGFENIEEYNDVETLNLYQERIKNGVPEDVIMRGIEKQSRDNARTPMQWDCSAHAGFTTGEPWIGVGKNYIDINVQSTLEEEDSIFNHFQKLIQLRKEKEIVTDGIYVLLDSEDENIWVYMRENNHEKWIIVSNFTSKELTYDLYSKIEGHYEVSIILSNYKDSSLKIDELKLRPYESIVYTLK